MAIVRDHQHLVADHGYTSVESPDRIAHEAGSEGAFPSPDQPSASRVERMTVITMRDVHDAFDHHRRTFEYALRERCTSTLRPALRRSRD